MKHIIVIGGGLTGLTAAIRLAEQGNHITLLEAAPQAGGRTRSFPEPRTGTLVDNGPHLLVGAYTATRELIRACAAEKSVTWQSSLSLPLWDQSRGHFCLKPKRHLPLALSLPLAVSGLPGHTLSDVAAMLRLAMRQPGRQSVAEWLHACGVSENLYRDMLEPLCLGAMNEHPDTADAASFARVLKESFASHEAARLGWFNKPLSEALIEPLVRHAEGLGVEIRLRTLVDNLQLRDPKPLLTLRDGSTMQPDQVILAIPAHARDRLLGHRHDSETRPITNVHLWFSERDRRLPAPLIGGIGTTGQWFLDIAQQMPFSPPGHFCVVISNDDGKQPGLVDTVTRELVRIAGWPSGMVAAYARVVTEQRATARVSRDAGPRAWPTSVIDACESPVSGDIPATIEAAVRRGQNAAKLYKMSHA